MLENRPFAYTSCSVPEHPSRPFLYQTLCEHSGGLVGRAAKWALRCNNVIAQIFVRDLISYISYFWRKVRNLVAYYGKPYTYTSVSDTTVAVRKFLAYESRQTLEYEIFTRTKISAITVRNWSILFALIIPKPLKFPAFSRDLQLLH